MENKTELTMEDIVTLVSIFEGEFVIHIEFAEGDERHA